ncbi:MAG: hypothetical protein IKP10_04815 [Clostridia bacterium]|nr:hypothetical protein [Clostridia bacterium]
MMHLLHYEFRRTRPVKWVLLGLAAAVQAVFMLSVYGRSRPGTVITALLLVFLAVGGTMATGLAGILLLHRDLTTEEGYMLFLTPRRCWSILGAKMLECFFSLTLCVAFFVGLIYADVRFLFAHAGKLHSYWRIGTSFLNNPTFYLQEVFNVNATVPIRVDLRDGSLIICAFVCYVATWESYMASATFAVVLAETVMPGKRRGIITAFLIFSVIGYGIHWAQTELPAVDPYQRSLLMASGLCLAVSVLMYMVTAPIMQKRLSV